MTEELAHLYVDPESNEVILELEEPSVRMSPEQAEEWCTAFYDAAQEAKDDE
jgi:hypothetical protein